MAKSVTQFATRDRSEPNVRSTSVVLIGVGNDDDDDKVHSSSLEYVVVADVVSEGK